MGAIDDNTVISFCDHCLEIVRDTSDDIGKVTCLKWLATFCNGVEAGDSLIDPEKLEEKTGGLIRRNYFFCF